MRHTQYLKEGFRFQKFAAGTVEDAVFTREFDDSTWRDSVPGIPAEPFVDSPECDMLQPALLIEDYTTSIRFNDCWLNALSGLLTNIMDPEEAAEFGQEQLELAITRK